MDHPKHIVTLEHKSTGNDVEMLVTSRAFTAAVLSGAPLRTGPDHFVENMWLIDEIYRRAGLPLRGV
ncbi:hypothetical protein ACFQ1S_32985 [Kibdelosporangium lantanae]|uniref:Uncharacterized protein n=1 Tax=Kibdelosporangium lantanae TaxID=1497396 RepID=A0ABW3MK89_9PSEU